jgi:hypothetical protein
VFCTQLESIQHLLFDCHFARFLWRAVHVTFNIDIPIEHLFNGWANSAGIQPKKVPLLFVGHSRQVGML